MVTDQTTYGGVAIDAAYAATTTGEPHAPLGKLVRLRRKAAGLSESRFAAESGVSRSTLCSLERGEVHRPGANWLARVVDLLSVTDAEVRLLLRDPEQVDAVLSHRHQALEAAA